MFDAHAIQEPILNILRETVHMISLHFSLAANSSFSCRIILIVLTPTVAAQEAFSTTLRCTCGHMNYRLAQRWL